MDRLNPPWGNPLGTPTLDWTQGGGSPRFDAGAARSFPPEVSAAIGRFSQGADDDQDRMALQFYLDSGQIDPQTAAALQQIITAMGSGGIRVAAPSQAPSPQGSWGGGVRGIHSTQPGFNYTPGGGDIRSQAASQAPANLPTPAPPDPVDYPLDSPIQGISLQNPGVIPPLPSSPSQVRRGGQDARRDQRGISGKEDWRGIAGVSPTSAFSDVNPAYMSAYMSSPTMVSRELNRGAPGDPNYIATNTATAMEPMVGSAMAMAQEGLLGGGGRGHGLGGPASAANKLSRVEDLMNSLGPGEVIDPAYVYRHALKRARNTDVGTLSTGSNGQQGDIGAQIQTTQDAILKPLQGIVDQDTYNGTASMLDREAMTWLDGVAHGTIDPNTLSFPEYLRRQKRQKFLGR